MVETGRPIGQHLFSLVKALGEEHVDGFAEFARDVGRVLSDGFVVKVHMPDLDRDRRESRWPSRCETCRNPCAHSTRRTVTAVSPKAVWRGCDS